MTEENKELEAVVEETGEKRCLTYLNKIEKVLVDGPSKRNPNILSGYTETGKLVHFEGNANLVGKIVNVKIKESHLYSLIGELDKQPSVNLTTPTGAASYKGKLEKFLLSDIKLTSRSQYSTYLKNLT